MRSMYNNINEFR